MSIRRQIQYLRADKSSTISALLIKGATDLSGHGFDHFPDDILSIATDVGFGATGDATMMLDIAGIGLVGSTELVADNVVDLLSEPYASSLQNAAVNTTGGLTPQTNRICCVELVDFPSGGIFSAVSTISGVAAQVCVWLFDADGVYLDDATNVTDPLTGKRYNQYTENGTLRTVPTNAAKMRVVTRLSTNADIAISDLSAFNITFY